MKCRWFAILSNSTLFSQLCSHLWALCQVISIVLLTLNHHCCVCSPAARVGNVEAAQIIIIVRWGLSSPAGLGTMKGRKADSIVCCFENTLLNLDIQQHIYNNMQQRFCVFKCLLLSNYSVSPLLFCWQTKMFKCNQQTCRDALEPLCRVFPHQPVKLLTSQPQFGFPYLW